MIFFRVGWKTGSFFADFDGAGDGLRNGLKTRYLFLIRWNWLIWVYSEGFETIFWLKPDEVVVGNLLENYLFLDSFGADFGGRKWDGTCRNFWAVGNFTFIGWPVVKKFLTTGFYIKSLQNTRFYIWVNNILKEYGRNLTNLDLAGRGLGDCNLCRFFYKMYWQINLFVL